MNDTLQQVRREKEKLIRQEHLLIQERLQQIAWFAQQYGLLTLQDEELCQAFEKIAALHNL